MGILGSAADLRATTGAKMLVLAALLGGCSDPITELAVVVGSDLDVPGELAAVQVTVRGAAAGATDIDPEGGETWVVPLDGEDAVTLPFSFGVTPRGGDASRRVEVELVGLSRRDCPAGDPACELVNRRVRTGFVAGKRLRLPLYLYASCRGRDCDDPGLTCAAGVCVEVDVDPNSLMTAGDEVDQGPSDVALDSGTDGGSDSGGDGGPDGSSELGDVSVIGPWNGFDTGSARVPPGAGLGDHPLRPEIRWVPTPGAQEYEVQIDDSCEANAFRSCGFPSPEMVSRTRETTYRPEQALAVSLVPPVGRRYYFRVRACAGVECSAYSEVRYLNVGRMPDDYNGDGYSDLTVGVTGYGEPVANAGAVHLFDGSVAGPPPSVSRTLSDPVPVEDGLFGAVVVGLGDVNGDGFADLAVAADQRLASDVSDGTVHVFHGGSGGLDATPSSTIDNPGGSTSDGFGAALGRVGDLNGDGYADLVIGAPAQSSPEAGEGNAFVYYGSAAGVASTPDLSLDNPLGVVMGRFGQSIAGAGDTNGDGYADVVIGAPFHNEPVLQAGSAYVFLGDSGGLRNPPARTLNNPEAQDGANFGWSVAMAADADWDGYSDVMIGAPGQRAPQEAEGNVFVFRGGASGIGTVPDATIDSPDNQVGALFGHRVASAGDVNGDGRSDFDVRGPLRSESAYLFFGSMTDFPRAPSHTLPTSSSFRQHGVGAGDLNGDGFADVVVGNADALVYFGSPAGPPVEADVTCAVP